MTRALVAAAIAALVLLGGCGKDTPTHAVPTIVGKPFPEARRDAEAAGLTVRVDKREFRAGTELGQVLAQDPASGELAEDEPIKLTVSKGPPPG